MAKSAFVLFCVYMYETYVEKRRQSILKYVLLFLLASLVTLVFAKASAREINEFDNYYLINKHQNLFELDRGFVKYEKKYLLRKLDDKAMICFDIDYKMYAKFIADIDYYIACIKVSLEKAISEYNITPLPPNFCNNFVTNNIKNVILTLPARDYRTKIVAILLANIADYFGEAWEIYGRCYFSNCIEDAIDYEEFILSLQKRLDVLEEKLNKCKECEDKKNESNDNHKKTLRQR